MRLLLLIGISGALPPKGCIGGGSIYYRSRQYVIQREKSSSVINLIPFEAEIG